MKKIVREPLIHFLIIGALIFVAYGRMSSGGGVAEEIVVTSGTQNHLVNIFTRTWQRPPTPQEFESLLKEWIREEIAFREGSAMGLDQGDTVVRRRLRQKLEMLTDEVVGMSEPTDSELANFLAENAERFRIEPRVSFRHVYFSRDRRGDQAEAMAGLALEVLQNDPDADWENMGDALPLDAHLEQSRLGEVEGLFGAQFARKLSELDRQRWLGPVESGYGMHLLIIDHYEPARDPALAEVREQVRAEWFARQRTQATDELYARLAEKYTISIEPLTGPEQQ